MDDLQHFIASKVLLPSQVDIRGRRASYYGYENRDSKLPIVTTNALHGLACPSSDDLSTCRRLNPRPDRISAITGNDTQQFQSKWHYALEKLEAKRQWRRASIELSESLDRRLERVAPGHFRELDTSIAAANTTVNDVRTSVTAMTAASIKVKDVTNEKGILVQVDEVSADEDADRAHVASDVDVVHVRFKESLVSDEQFGRPTVKEQIVQVKSTTISTPGRSGNSVPSTPNTPFTAGTSFSQVDIELTPDTPASILGPLQKISVTTISDTNSDNSFKPPILADDIFTPQFGNYSRNPGGRLRPRHSIASNGSPLSSSRDAMSATRLQATSPGVVSEARITLFPPRSSTTLDSTAPQGSALQLQKPELSSSFDQRDVFVKTESATTIGSLPRSIIEESKPSPDDTSTSETSLQGSLYRPIGTSITKRKSEFRNGLEAYDRAIGLCTWEQFKSDPTSCYGLAKTRGRRCTIRTIRGTRSSIHACIKKLEDIDPDVNYEDCLRLIEELANLTLCEVNWSERWCGHKDSTNYILRTCKNLLAACKPSNHQTIVAEITLAKPSASFSLRPESTAIKIASSLPDTATGFEPWQPPSSARKDVSSYLRELILTSLDLQKERGAGSIYAYRTEGIFGHIKIGYTGRDIKTRLAEWRDQCRHEPISVLGSKGRVPHVARVEALVHAELKDSRRKQTKCTCGTTHIEWFEASPNLVRWIIEKWSAWIELGPYDDLGKLKAQHYRDLDELSKPTEARTKNNAETDALEKHVRSLEQKFNFSFSLPANSVSLTNFTMG